MIACGQGIQGANSEVVDDVVVDITLSIISSYEKGARRLGEGDFIRTQKLIL